MSGDVGVQIGLIDEVVQTCSELGVPVWLRGGWAMDFYLGRVTRAHRDIDWFIDSVDADRVEAALVARGFLMQESADRGLQRELERDGEELSLTLVVRADDGSAAVASGPFAGAAWPSGMLGSRWGRIGTVSAPVIEPSAQIEIKVMMPAWVPGLARRDKDRTDVELLSAAMLVDPST